jgi:NADPH:quinone reductase-like Zn-dependent oxidoreductase
MTIVTAYVLDRGEPGRLTLRPTPLAALQVGEVLAEPLFGCWEGNMTHALQRCPVDICQQRDEPWVVLGNAGVVRVLECGPGVTELCPGQACVVFCAGDLTAIGFPRTIYAYDQPGSVGILAKRTKLLARQLLPLPMRTRHSLRQWAAFSLRYVTAWANWWTAIGCWRAVAGDTPPRVRSWGGGVSFAELTLARLQGCPATMITSSDRRLAEIAAAGLTSADRRPWARLNHDEEAFRRDPARRDEYRAAESRFLEFVRRATDGDGVSIFLDYVGRPVHRATLKALGCPGVLTTAGWKAGMNVTGVRAVECLHQHVHVHTHYARREDGEAAVRFAEEVAWIPPEPDRVWRWEEVPELARRYAAGEENSYFPVFSINSV